MNIEEIRQKYSVDSKGAFGNEKNPMKKHDMRANLNNNAELENVKKRIRTCEKSGNGCKSSLFFRTFSKTRSSDKKSL